jgi:hypothetical protein
MGKQIYNLKIDEELRDLLPSLAEDEFKQLEENLIKDGCQSPLFVWKGYIADGHNRYKICTKHKIPFEIVNLGYEDKSDVMRWMIDTQIGRRNLEPIQRIQISEKYRPIFEMKAKENKEKAIQKAREYNPNNCNEQFSQKSAESVKPIDTRDEMAKLAGVSHDTYNKGRTILKSDNEDVKKKVLSGEMSINAGYNVIKPKETKIFQKEERKQESIQKTNKVCKKCSVEKNLSEFENNNDFCKECVSHLYEIPKQQNNKEKENSYYQDDITKNLKTEKLAKDYLNVDAEVNCACDEILNQIDLSINRIFESDMEVSRNMTFNNKVFMCNKIDEMINKLNGFKYKIKNIKIEGKNINE